MERTSPRLPRSLVVWTNGRRVARWRIASSGSHSLTYEREGIDAVHDAPLSLSLPLSRAGRPLRGARVASFFDHLLPAAAARLRLQALFGLPSVDSFDLLSVLGRDCAGALQLMPEDAVPGDMQGGDGEPLDDRALSRLLDALAAAPGTPAAREVRLPAVALGGERAKTALSWQHGQWRRPTASMPSSHIVKLPLGAQPGGAAAFNTSLENEWLCVRLLAAFGLELPPTRIDTIGAHKVLVVARSDRCWLDQRGWARLPAENLCQATATPVRKASEDAGGPGLKRLLELLRGSDVAAQDRERLLAATVVMWMLAVPDVSARRFMLRLLPAGHFRLAPLSGVMSAWPLLGRQPSAASLRRLPFGLSGAGVPMRHHEFTRATWQRAAQRHALGAGFDAVLDGLAGWAEPAIERVGAELPDGFPASVSGAVFEGVRRSARVIAAR